MIVTYLPLFGVLALAFVFWKNAWVTKQDEGDDKMKRIAKNIADGAMSFLKAEYKVLSVFVVAVAILLYVFIPIQTVIPDSNLYAEMDYLEDSNDLDQLDLINIFADNNLEFVSNNEEF